MQKHIIYSYRLTHFSGTAPCYDGNILSLAICKRDMRRVMGREFFQNKHDTTYWFVGIIGAGLVKNKDCFFKDDEAGRIIYIAKLSSVVEYQSYFSDKKYCGRLDRIYKEKDDGPFVASDNGIERRFAHVGSNVSTVHIERWLQERDWDIKHNDKKNVLISKEYAFINKATSSEIIQKVLDCDGKLATGVGHTYFEANENSSIVKAFEDEILKAGKKHGKDNLPKEIQNGCAKGCGKDKA